MLKKKYSHIFATLLVCLMMTLSVPLVFVKPEGIPRGSHAPVYVTSQYRYYDTIVPISQTKGLPWKDQNNGSFQQLYPTGGPTGGLSTDYGPGDPGYRGGRWWIDYNPNGYQDEYDIFFLCPLLGGPVKATLP